MSRRRRERETECEREHITLRSLAYMSSFFQLPLYELGILKWPSPLPLQISSKSPNYRHLFIAVYDAYNDDAVTTVSRCLAFAILQVPRVAFNQNGRADN